jgi:predicted enzyme related to lactoylglutathione lyase
MQTSTTINYPSDIEWISTDYRASADYLTKTFGWDVKDMPEHKMAFGEVGHKLTVMIRSEMPYDKGLGQQASFYMTVSDVNLEIARLQKLGATIFKEPETVPNMGVWALVMIPGRVVLGLWAYLPGAQQPIRKITKKITDEGALGYFEMVNTDAKGLVDFFKNAYGWKFDESTFLGGSFWYVSDKETFSLGIREARQGERNDLVGFVNVTNLGMASSNLSNTGSRALGTVLDYEPHGFCQKFIIPGGILLGLWGPSRIAPTQVTPPVQASKPIADTERVPMTQEERELAGH